MSESAVENAAHRKSAKSRSHAERSSCPIARALDILGDRWTLLVVRDLLFLGKRQFGQFLGSCEKMPTNILADRLRRLADSGLVTRSPYQHNPVRYQYELTDRGRELQPTVEALGSWAHKHLGSSDCSQAES